MAKKLGRKLTTGRFETREELEEAIYFASYGEGARDTDIGIRYGVSQTLSRTILAKFKPSLEQQAHMLSMRISRQSKQGQNVEHFVKERQEILNKIQAGN